MSQYPSPEDIVSLATICVGVGPGGTTSMLARQISTRIQGECLLDTFVRPTMPVTDHRGIQPWQLTSHDAVPFEVVQQTIANIIRGKIIVGYKLWDDLSVLGTPHPAKATRDVALYLVRGMNAWASSCTDTHQAFYKRNEQISLANLIWHLMRRRCQEGRIDPTENARAAMDLYRSAPGWEVSIFRGDWACRLPPSSFSAFYQ
ncbi:hypothetical protein B0H13DRAFT_1586655 [Mycena leptocephala]|nr:hypothetical protein B0H13DRAFT_1586655 [Mycena leptocephala]